MSGVYALAGPRDVLTDDPYPGYDFNITSADTIDFTTRVVACVDVISPVVLGFYVAGLICQAWLCSMWDAAGAVCWGFVLGSV